MLYSRSSLVISFIPSGVYVSVPISQFIPPPLSSPGVHTFVLYIYVSWMVGKSKREGICVHIWLVHFAPQRELAQHRKATIPQ